MKNTSLIKGRLKPAFFVFLLSVCFSVYAKNDTFLSKYPDDFFSIIVSPKNWGAVEYTTLTGLCGFGLILYNNDSSINKKFLSNQNSLNDNLSSSVKLFGDKYLLAAGFMSTYALSAVTDDNKLRKTSLLGIESMVISAFFTYSLKALTHRHRPDESTDPHKFSGPSFSTDNMSFPSGHTTFAFSTAKIINECYSDKNFLPYITYSAAILTGLSRIYENEHWASDVLTGAVIGYYTASIISNNSVSSDTDISISYIDGNPGISFSLKF